MNDQVLSLLQEKINGMNAVIWNRDNPVEEKKMRNYVLGNAIHSPEPHTALGAIGNVSVLALRYLAVLMTYHERTGYWCLRISQQ
jgi:hypothetical protein